MFVSGPERDSAQEQDVTQSVRIASSNAKLTKGSGHNTAYNW